MPSTLPERESDRLCLVKEKMQEFMEREIAGNELNRIFAKVLVCRYDKNYRLVTTHHEFGPWWLACVHVLPS